MHFSDVLIFRYLLEEKLTPRDRERTHVFSSFFYKRLTQREYGSQSGNELKLTPAEKRHLKVRKWTRRVDLFKKDFIIIPINERFVGIQRLATSPLVFIVLQTSSQFAL